MSAGATDGASAGAGAGAGAADQSTIARHLSDFRRDPADSTAFNALRRAYQGQSRDPELAALYERRADHLAEGHGAADLLWRAAEIHHARGNAESELRVLNKAVARDKGHQRALERLKGLAQATERWTELVRLLELEIEGLAEAGRDTRRAARLEFELGQLWEQRLGRMDRAIACYQRAFAGDATHAEAIEAGRRIYAQVGHFETVAQLYRVELETITDTRTKIDRLLALGQLYRDKLGDMESAARCYTEALQLRPGNEELMETLGEIYASPEWPSPGGLDKAASIYMQIAQRRQSRGDRDGAIGYLRRALGADPENEAAATRLERAYQETGRWADLDRLYRQRISVASDLEATQLLMRRAELLERKLGDRQGARECYETVLPREVLGGPASTRLKELYRADEDWEKLEQLLQRELDGAKDRNARLKLMMEIALIRRDHGVDSEGAAVLLHEILQIDPEHRKALAAYEDYFRQKGDYRNLSELLRYAAQSAREANAPPMEICARLEELADVCERRLGDLEGAAEAWQQIADLHPDTGRSKESLRRIGVRMRMWQQRKAAMEHELSQAFGASERLDVLRRCAKAYHDQMLDPLDLAEILREILTQSPGDESALRMLVEIYEREADHEGVAWALSHQLDGILTKVERARVLKRLAEVYAEQLDRPTDAIAAYQELAELTPTDRAAVTKLQQLLDQADDLEELARVLGRRVEAARSADERLKALKELAKLMDDRLEAPARAIECWEDVRALMPHDEEALAALTRLTEDTGDYVKLLSILRQRFDAALEDPDAPPAPAGVTMTNPGALTPAARAGLLKKIAHVAEQKLSRPDEAAAAYEELAELLPASREALEALERLYSQLGYHERLASVLSRQLDLADDAEERVVLAFKQVDVLEGQLGDIDRAAEAFERILDELAPADLDAHRRLKQLHLRRNDFARAAEIAERELFLVPDSDDRRRDRLELALEIADLWWRRAQDAQRAQLAYERVLSIDNENAEALRELRRIYHRTESYEELVRRASAIFAAIESDRERQVLLLELAQVCEDRLQDPTRAFEWYRRANDLYPDDGTALQHLRRLASEHEMWHELLAVYRESLRRVIGSAEHMALIFEMSRIADEHLGDQHAAFEILISGLEVDPRGEQLLEPMTRVAEQSGQQRALYDVYHHLLEREDEPVRRDRLLAQRAQIADEALRDPVRALADEVRRYELGVCDEAALVERIEALARRARSWGPVLAVHRVRYERAEDDELRLSILEHVAGLFEENLGDKRRAFEVWLQAFGVRKDEHTVGQCWRLAGELSGRAGEGDADAELEVDADDIVDAKEASHPEADPAAGEAWDGPTVAMRQPAHEAPLVIEPTKKRRDDTIELSLSDAAMMVAVAPAVGRRKSADESDINIESSKKRRDKTIELSLTDAALLVGGAPRKPRKDETMELDGS
ncbi:MAG: tetratricopeptide repeat protein, partial [Myxococcales bacterium]|nr:tetratricopeptide repeat protein [Myxococcales bacterium]